MRHSTRAFLLVPLCLLASACSDSGVGASGSTAGSCAEAAEAAHYIAAMSGSSGRVVAVTNQVIADRKYPDLGDKEIAAIGNVVAASNGIYTPDEISEKIRAACK